MLRVRKAGVIVPHQSVADVDGSNEMEFNPIFRKDEIYTKPEYPDAKKFLKEAIKKLEEENK